MKNKENLTQELTQEQVWDRIAQQWEKFRKKQPIKEIVSFLKEKSEKNRKNKKIKILDIGCGSGRHFFKLNNAVVYGVDSSEEMLKLAKKCVKKKKIKAVLKKASAEKLPFKDNFFDAAVFAATLHCIDSTKRREKSLRELFRVLKKEGESIISVWSKKHKRVKNKPKSCFLPWTINGKRYLRYYYLYDKKELENLLKKIGFKILKSWENDNIFVAVRK